MSYQFELRHLRYFLTVAEELHYRKASERLYMSQPGLSKQIKLLEEGLGFKLFERHNRKVELTKAGEYLQVEFQRSMNQLDKAVHHAKLINDGLKGDIRFGYVGSAMQKILPDLLVAFKKKNPNILFSLKEMDNQIQIDNLISQDIDVGFVRMDRIPVGLNSHAVIRECFCLVLPKGHKINSKNFKSIGQLKDESFIMFDPEYSQSYYDNVMQIFNDAGFVPNVSHSTIHSSSIYKLVENKFGISIVPKSLYSKASLETLQFIDLNKIPQRTVLSAIWSEGNKNPILGDFVKEIKKIKISKRSKH